MCLLLMRTTSPISSPSAVGVPQKGGSSPLPGRWVKLSSWKAHLCMVIRLVGKSEPMGHKGYSTTLKQVVFGKAESPLNRTHLKAQGGKLPFWLAATTIRVSGAYSSRWTAYIGRGATEVQQMGSRDTWESDKKEKGEWGWMDPRGF